MILHQEPDDQVADQFFDRDYHDRGMLKWGGFYLSDHTSALAKMHAAEQIEPTRPQQDEAAISDDLASAWRYKKAVHLQLNVFSTNQTITLADGWVAGVNEDQIVLRVASGRYRRFPLSAVRNVTFT